MAENRMELFIETLTGTAFELSCSPLETIVSIKAKIQYSEGIPVSQQHLIWKSQELNDDLCLQDYSITDGATLKLVLGMRGGPINTRQVSDTRKLKDLADYVERKSDTGGSGGRPFTVLVFHDGDKVHMYTLMERGDCSVSPLSGTISETSSVASIKNVEELDQELIKENEVTKEKIAQLQEQIRKLNINRSRKVPAPSPPPQVKDNQTKSAKNINEDFHLPPLQRVDSFDPQDRQYFYHGAQYNRPAKNSYISHFVSDVGSRVASPNEEEAERKSEKRDKLSNEDKTSAALQCVSESISSHLITPPDKDSTKHASHSCSNFLPYISSSQKTPVIHKKPFCDAHTQTAHFVGISLSSSCLNSVIKNDPSSIKKTHKRVPLTSNQALSSQRFHELDEWMQSRPKTSPEESIFRNLLQGDSLYKNKLLHGDRGKHKPKRLIKNQLPVALAPGEKSSVILQTYSNHRDVSYGITSTVASKGKSNYASTVGTLAETGIKGFKTYSPNSGEKATSKVKSMKASPKTSDEILRPHSGRKLPLIKAKKKSYKRCSLCSKKTGLATSYTCRCGKNFCASHRYAETHQCSYDYKTEGRRVLQLNNPVVAASKLPKI